ncbi:hypothetical protein HMPREF0653_02000 [Prevotella disiens JCM 6334 = ATCC 29426]|uniref:Uncharacterized protein n=1 Tax=Prevotella disiens JCM 6334 = ATCC 29426 TaxID=1235811 RepID=A0ABP2Y8W6_9BACT|nr:hypothetical protein HMPREF0653_02000 [Prevotella disiens JCM 6334 = ATCC 29426]
MHKERKNVILTNFKMKCKSCNKVFKALYYKRKNIKSKRK